MRWIYGKSLLFNWNVSISIYFYCAVQLIRRYPPNVWHVGIVWICEMRREEGKKKTVENRKISRVSKFGDLAVPEETAQIRTTILFQEEIIEPESQSERNNKKKYDYI